MLWHALSLSNSKQDDSMPALGYAIAFGMNQVVHRLQRSAVSLLREGANFILQSIRGRREIRNDLLEHRISGVLGRQQSLDVLHHEDGGLVNLDDPQVLLVEKVLLVLVEILVVGAP